MSATTRFAVTCIRIAALLAVLSSATPVPSDDEYEYVIVGSGPGGGTLAANLAREGHSVFLIEAGDDYGDELVQQVPSWSGMAAENATMAWQFFVNHYQNETQARRDVKYTYRYDNGSYYVGLDPPEGVTPLGILYPRGMTLGGSSQVNAMNFIYPPDSDWRHIAELTGDDSWSPDEMRQHFIEYERNAYLPPDTPGHGFDGYIADNHNNISYAIDRPGVVDVASNAVSIFEGTDVKDDTQLAQLLQRDINSIQPDRYEHPSVHQLPAAKSAHYRRSSTRNYAAKILYARDENGSPKYPLTLSPHSLAHRVLFKNKGSKPTAYGVEYLVGEALYAADPRYNASQTAEVRTVRASREVIVAGGAFNTPQLLKLSGIGPREELEKFDIPVVMDLPAVGSTLQDNYEGPVNVLASKNWPNNQNRDCLFDPNATASEDPCLDVWMRGQGGPYGEASATLGITFRSSAATNEDDDIHIFGSPNAELRGFFPGFSHAPAPPNGWGWSVVKMQVDSPTGTISLRSKDPRDTPVINFNFFEKHRQQDLRAMAEGTDLLLRTMNSLGRPYAPYEVIDPTIPDNLEQSVMDNAYSHHASCSCRMGPKGDRNYCVDSKFRVNGVQNLRIVDASIFPRPIGAFPLASVYTISHKAFKTIMADLAY